MTEPGAHRAVRSSAGGADSGVLVLPPSLRWLRAALEASATPDPQDEAEVLVPSRSWTSSALLQSRRGAGRPYHFLGAPAAEGALNLW